MGLSFQVDVNRLLAEVKPYCLLIEPTGLGHPKRVLDMLTEGYFRKRTPSPAGEGWDERESKSSKTVKT